MFDYVIRNARLHRNNDTVDIGIKDGRFAEIEKQLSGKGAEEYEADGYLVIPPFVDSHFHMDATLSLGLPRMNQSGTLLEGIQQIGRAHV